jgi:hypothetical protein
MRIAPEWSMSPALINDEFSPHGSPKTILLAKSEIRAIYLWQPVENLVCQRAGRRENDFASSIKSDDDPGGRDHVCGVSPSDA